MLSVEGIGKIYGEGRSAYRAIDSVTFDVNESEIVTVVGPSGCGKTTLLKCISGLLPPTDGRSVLNGIPVTEPPEGLGIVFQDYSRSLYPWMSVAHNVAFPLAGKGIPRNEINDRVERTLAAVGLRGQQRKKPFQLSGGMQQRVAIARALAYQPKVLLMDEPFASVDAQTRAELEDTVVALRAEFNVTVLFITHDIDEAVYMADRIVVLTPPPTTVSEIVEVSLPFPRDQIGTKELAEFVKLRSHVYRAVKNRWDDRQPGQ
ncbi:ABC transporter ATP-binding protein [Micromonospora radicis]|uniref:ABC transporter ATP-binding protein n=1 Tax=Micromonospora radicis TaxID=1894971 RepID=A0A418MXD6_9ACTN|nr:ABC transporter ATP-binding protein [Micromonospora radicis]